MIRVVQPRGVIQAIPYHQAANRLGFAEVHLPPRMHVEAGVEGILAIFDPIASPTRVTLSGYRSFPLLKCLRLPEPIRLDLLLQGFAGDGNDQRLGRVWH